MSSVDKHRIGSSPINGGVYLYRHGKDPRLALDKRDALQEVMVAACEHLLYGMEGGASAEISINDRTYVVVVVPAKVRRKDGRLVKNPKLKGIR